MIRIGYNDDQKRQAIATYAKANEIRRIVALGPKRFRLPLDRIGGIDVEHVEWSEIILYRFYYRLLRETDPDTLLLINEPLRTQNRYDLTYNCLRNFLQQTKHQIIFSCFPQINTFEDFMILVDLDTRSKWRREPFRPSMLGEIDLQTVPRLPKLVEIPVPVRPELVASYEREKRKLIDALGLGDPHTIPRQLHMRGGRAKLELIDSRERYVGRNNRFKLSNLTTYESALEDHDPIVFEFCHRFIDWSDFIAASQPGSIRALVSELKVDRWYMSRFASWEERVRDAYATLHG